MSEPLVFTVDDDASVRRALHRLLDAAGYRSETFSSAEGFLARAPHDGPSCLLLDLQMPGLDGLEAQERLVEAGHALPVVFLTGHGDIPASVRAMRQGALDFLTKPIEAERLLAAVEAALEQDRERLDSRRELEHLIGRYHDLTAREREVFSLVAVGLLNKQIGRRLGISEKTVKAHRGRVMEKMQADSVAHLVRMHDRLAGEPPELR